ncbi:helix-turn-helix domain-containing protein [Candidatus Daviesbacteria bacterium]|nr:helix-turn-helix domain-containing protein [Candidatus Daviesbacteria bacterium]
MDKSIIEANFPISFRADDALSLGKNLQNRRNVVLVGMKRVGIGSFIRFFLYHPEISKTYIQDDQNHLFIPVDLNNLVEREIFPFWILTLKRIVDEVEKSPILKDDVKKYIESLFLDSIQSKDLFLLIESLRKSLVKIVESGVLPTIFFIRFDRMKDAATPEFFDNLQGLQDATHQKLSYVFTSYRTLDKLSPEVFSRADIMDFCIEQYIKPETKTDSKTILDISKERSKLKISNDVEEKLLEIVDGYYQYMQLALIYLHEHNLEAADLLSTLVKDERINLQSEELWESLNSSEQTVLVKASKNSNLTESDFEEGKYLFDTGMLIQKNNQYDFFSPLFESFIKTRQTKTNGDNLSSVDFSKKEHTLFSFLQKNLGMVCEREAIIATVWPEVDNLGVTDWAIDRLIARLRNKLKLQKSPLEIVTVKTRGYKLINANG